MPNLDQLKHGTKHHDHMHKMNRFIQRIKKATSHIYVHDMINDMRDHIEKYVMSNIEKEKL